MNLSEKYSKFKIMCMGCSSMGFQFAYAIMFALSDPLVDLMNLPSWAKFINMSLGPIAGFFIQPIIGVYSDKCKSRYGRRRPFILAGAISTGIGIIGVFILKSFYQKMSTGVNTFLFLFFVAWTYFSINCFQGPSRSIISDILSDNQQEVGNTIVSTMIGLASILPNLLGGIGYFAADSFIAKKSNEIILIVGSILIFITVPITLMSAKEEPFTGIVERKNFFSQLWHAASHMPRPMVRVAIAILLSWMAYYNFTFKTTTMMVEEVIKDKSAGLCFGMLVNAIVNLLSFLYGIVHTKVLTVLGSKNAYTISHVIMACCLFALFFVGNRWIILCLLAPLGISCTIFNAVPYSVVGSCAPPEEMGVYMGCINSFVVIGQQVANILNFLVQAIHSALPQSWGLGVNRTYIAFGSIAAIAASVMSAFIIIPRRDDYCEIHTDE